jgi:hypothetical protein
MNPIIIIEGPDGCGKTTWCEYYKAMFGAKYMHLALHKNLFAYQTMSLVRAVHWAKKVPVLIDRHWPSEQIYGSVYRGTCLHREAELLEKFCDEAGVFYVVAVGDDAETMASWHEESSASRKEMFSPSSDYLNVLRGYLDWWSGRKTCAVDIGHCEKSKPMCSKFFSAFRYDREKFKGHSSIADHIRITQVLATNWRNYRLSLNDFNQLTKTQLINQCGYEAHKNSD